MLVSPLSLISDRLRKSPEKQGWGLLSPLFTICSYSRTGEVHRSGEDVRKHTRGRHQCTHKQVTSNYPLPRVAETPPWNQRCSPRTGLVSPNSKALKRCLTGPAGHLVQLLRWPRHRLELQHMHPSPPQLMNPQLSSLLPCSSATISRKKEQTCLFSKRVL